MGSLIFGKLFHFLFPITHDETLCNALCKTNSVLCLIDKIV